MLNDTLIYVAIDYCGMEILSVRDTSNIRQLSWWNPWKCETPANNWFNSPGHTNEIAYDKNCEIVFMSSGKSEMHAVSVANPAKPDSCASFGNTTNSEGTWGIGLYKNRIYVAYVFMPFGIPFFSNWSGIKEIIWNNKCTGSTGNNPNRNGHSDVFPNPTTEGIFHLRLKYPSDCEVIIFDALGRLIYKENLEAKQSEISINLDKPEGGTFLVAVRGSNFTEYKKLIVLVQ